MRKLRLLAFAVPLAAALAGCGNKGDLVRPTPPATATPAGDTAPPPPEIKAPAEDEGHPRAGA